MILYNFMLSVNAVVPIFVVIFLGYIIRRRKLSDDRSIGHMNAIAFNFALPMLLFRDLYNSDFHQMFDGRFIAYAVFSTILIFLLLWLFAALFIKDKKSVGAFVQGSFRGNYAIVGLPLVANILGDMDTGKGLLVITFIIPIYNVLSVIVLTVTSGNRDNRMIITACKNIIKNPLIIGIAAGLVFSFFQIKLPTVLLTPIGYMGNLATPLALIAIGGSIEPKECRAKAKLAIMATAIKLIVLPLIFLPIGMLVGLNGEDLVVLFVMYAAPTAISSYIMTVNMEGDAKLSLNILLLTTMFSVFTFTLGAFLFYMYVL